MLDFDIGYIFADHDDGTHILLEIAVHEEWPMHLQRIVQIETSRISQSPFLDT